MRERELYPRLRRFAESQLGCFTTAIDKGLDLGRIDIIGLRDTGGRLTGEGEVVAIEAKRGTAPFLTSIGQAAAYSVMADRCYLADVRPNGYTGQELEIAQELGVGLLAVTGNKRFRVTEELAAPRSTTVSSLRTELVERLQYSICTVCRSFFKRGREGTFSETTRRSIHHAHDAEKGFVYWLYEQADRSGTNDKYVYHRRYVCPDCVYALWPPEET